MSRFLSIGEAMVELSRAGAGENDLWRLGYAGDTLNTAWYARACLPPDWQVEYLSRLGADPFSARMMEFLTKARIGTSFITRDPIRSVGLYAIELQDGERSFAYWRGQSAARLLAEDHAHLDAAFAAADGIYLSGITLAILPDAGREALLSRLAHARAQGKLTAFDPNLRPNLWENPEAMRHWLTAAAKGARILMPSFEDDANWFGDDSLLACAARWQAAGAEEIVVKNGGGTMGYLAGDDYREVEVEMLKPVDTTGAGDSFNGAYLAGRLTGQGCDDALREGHAVASQVIARFGALVPLRG
ncbi:MAG: sugar kinase [Paracoccus sp. (in: a-proteobacteria)]|uniref:sugar kinase n=1 Tax=Paracoccus sp. TaxID=267 RepID=UPI0026DEEB6F|nr:sugar kinase [Paracoccus sp. (in: a-proteobacteria)]MDO5613075.1 sugar kinase [Paracoccus sp. (in: a-proteobacteria)]